jgi:tetratricopeptide (TPR) repeat protein
MTELPGTELFLAIVRQNTLTQAAFMKLLSPPPDTATRVVVHREYREAAAELLELERQHNESGFAPTPWDLTTIAQPLYQQTMIEADLVDALGRRGEADLLRGWARTVATTYLGEAALGRMRREEATRFSLEGRFNESLTALADVRRAFTDAGDVVQASQTALDEASVLEWLGDDERALRAIREARDLVDERLSGRPLPTEASIISALQAESASILGGQGMTGQSDEEAALWRISVELIEHEARVRKALGELDEAARLWKSVLPHYASLGPEAAASIEYQLAAVELGNGNHEAAWARLEQIEPLFVDGLLRPRRIGLRGLQADISLSLGQPMRALELADDGISELPTFPDDDVAWRLHWRRGRALAALERPEEALAAYSEAAAVVDSLRKSPLGYRLDSTYLRSKLPLFDAAIDLAAEQGDGSAAAGFIELVKARALSSALSIRPQARKERTELELEFDDVTRRLDALEFQGYRGDVAGPEAYQQRVELLARRLELIEEVRLRDPRWRGLSEPVPFDAQQVAAALEERSQAALTLYVRDGRVVSVLLAGGEIEVASQEIAADAADLLAQYTANLLRPTPDPFLLDFADLGVGADAFVPPTLLERAVAAGSLLIAPHRTLHLLTWPVLTFSGKRLFEYLPVGMVPNLSCTSTLGTDFASAPRAALAGTSEYEGLPGIDALPATALELADLRTLYDGRLVAPPLLGPEATEASVRQLAARPDADGAILHLSCHGTLSVEDPLGSGLLLVDGKIDAAELATTALHYEEVVLSACSTGWRPQAAEGIELSGDDVLGLPGAVLEGGASSIVVSIPKAIDEVTRDFMVAYHTARAGGETPLAAFRTTQLQLLDSEHEPYTWAGLVCYSVR